MDKRKKAKVIEELSKQYGSYCHYCGVELAYPTLGEPEKIIYDDGNHIIDQFYYYPPNTTHPTIDHKIPTAKGGNDTIDNLVLSCNECNATKAARYSYEEFLKKRKLT